MVGAAPMGTGGEEAELRAGAAEESATRRGGARQGAEERDPLHWRRPRASGECRRRGIELQRFIEEVTEEEGECVVWSQPLLAVEPLYKSL